MSTLLVVLAVGATMRLTRLVTKDYLTAGPRRWVQQHAPEKIAYLVGCPWCTSFWLGGAVAGITVAWPTNRAVFALWLALTGSWVTGMFGNLDPPEDFGEPDLGGAEPESPQVDEAER